MLRKQLLQADTFGQPGAAELGVFVEDGLVDVADLAQVRVSQVAAGEVPATDVRVIEFNADEAGVPEVLGSVEAGDFHQLDEVVVGAGEDFAQHLPEGLIRSRNLFVGDVDFSHFGLLICPDILIHINGMNVKLEYGDGIEQRASYNLRMEEHIGETIERMLDRNARVEAEKAWEQSYARIGSIALITYACVAVVLYIIGVEQYLVSAIVPVIGYLLSTLSLPFLKSWWIARYRAKGN